MKKTKMLLWCCFFPCMPCFSCLGGRSKSRYKDYEAIGEDFVGVEKPGRPRVTYGTTVGVKVQGGNRSMRRSVSLSQMPGEHDVVEKLREWFLHKDMASFIKKTKESFFKDWIDRNRESLCICVNNEKTFPAKNIMPDVKDSYTDEEQNIYYEKMVEELKKYLPIKIVNILLAYLPQAGIDENDLSDYVSLTFLSHMKYSEFFLQKDTEVVLKSRNSANGNDDYVTIVLLPDNEYLIALGQPTQLAIFAAEPGSDVLNTIDTRTALVVKIQMQADEISNISVIESGLHRSNTKMDMTEI